MEINTVIERQGSSIIYRCNQDFEIPALDVLSLLFDSSHCSAKESTTLHVDAANPSLSLTKSQCRDLTKRIAFTLRHEYGVGASKTPSYVTCISTGSYVLPNVFYGVVAAGGIFSSASSSATVQELVRFIKLAPSNLVICNPDTRGVTLKAAMECDIPEKRVLIIDAEGCTLRDVTGRNVLRKEMLDWRRITDKKELEQTVLCLIFSSGTTGLPKGVPLSHHNIVAEVVISCNLLKAQVFINNPNFEYNTIAHLPTAHIAGVQGYFINPFYMGGPTYWMSRFNFAEFLEYNKRYNITFFFTVPPIFLLMAKSPAVTDHFDNLQVAISGAAPMGRDLQEAVSRKLGKGKTFVSQTWGLSESTGSATLLNNYEKDLTGSVSRILPNIQARIVDEIGQDVSPGSEGEVYLKGPIIFRGYHQNSEATTEAFDADGWFRTGDVGMFKDGLLYIVDRKKELIKYKGLQVAPAELEALLLSHPDILDAAVIGVDWEGTEVPRAYIVANRNKISAEKVIQFVKDNVASYKQLRGGVVFLNAIPKSPSGKILRKDLRAMAKPERSQLQGKL